MNYSSQDKKPEPSNWQHWSQEKYMQQKITGNPPSPKITHAIIPSLPPVYNTDQLEFLSLDPPQCFCKRTAHRSFTLEYGPILECFSYSRDIQFTCGFHVHELSWNKFRLETKQGDTVSAEFIELRACPLYNFTFCTLFNSTNSYYKIPPAVLPECFCGYSVQFREKKLNDHYHKLFFTCKNISIEGVKKCAWHLNAKEVAFAKPKNRLHRYVSVETYQRHQQEKKNILQQSKTQHHSHLLATLSAKLSSVAAHSLVVPTSVLAKKQPAVPLSSSSTSISPTLSSPIFQEPSYELQEEANLPDLSVLQIKLRIKDLEAQVTKYMDKEFKFEFDHKDKLVLLKYELELESMLRLSEQERLSNIEAGVVTLTNEKEKLAKEFQDYKEQMFDKYGKEKEHNKCKVCFSNTIEYVLTPCFHMAYCETCAQKLKECAICRKEINDIHKIYSC